MTEIFLNIQRQKRMKSFLECHSLNSQEWSSSLLSSLIRFTLSILWEIQSLCKDSCDREIFQSQYTQIETFTEKELLLMKHILKFMKQQELSDCFKNLIQMLESDFWQKHSLNLSLIKWHHEFLSLRMNSNSTSFSLHSDQLNRHIRRSLLNVTFLHSRNWEKFINRLLKER